MKHFTKALRALQFILKARFGDRATSAAGECSIHIGPDKVELTGADHMIEARGPARVARVLVRKRRKR